jgi:hypothetical protein
MNVNRGTVVLRFDFIEEVDIAISPRAAIHENDIG